MSESSDKPEDEFIIIRVVDFTYPDPRILFRRSPSPSPILRPRPRPRPRPKPKPEFITLRLRESKHVHRETAVCVERRTPLGGMMKDYTAKMGRIPDEIRFIAYDGSRLVEDNTVESVSYKALPYSLLDIKKDLCADTTRTAGTRGWRSYRCHGLSRGRCIMAGVEHRQEQV